MNIDYHFPYKLDDRVRVTNPLSAKHGLTGPIIAIDWELEDVDVMINLEVFTFAFAAVKAEVVPDDEVFVDDPIVKDGNPKDGIGAKKPPLFYVPRPVLYEVGNALFEGSRKYGAYNWRIVGVRASIYVDAAGRHTDAWLEGEDLDPDSGIHHLSKAIAGLMVIRDAMICDKFVDDRPPSAPEGWMKKAQAQTDAIIGRHPTSKAPYTQVGLDL